ncbi:Uncharacterised protein [Mycobacterium tuberculosis]|uniref:Uncharacterized protein n=1 Tax=Mycobacterium tuberculosis TaxID=1773 RepID=A0A654U6M0_MYCTX|nr:Uncharacterised protein [Mycobacterium tuberculosis]
MPRLAIRNAANRTPPTVARLQRRLARAANSSVAPISNSGQTT